MKNILKLVISTASAATLTGCIDPANYATTPVSVTTETGNVVCQLYRTNNVLWDEAISIPPGMSISTGDSICKNKRALDNRKSEIKIILECCQNKPIIAQTIDNTSRLSRIVSAALKTV